MWGMRSNKSLIVIFAYGTLDGHRAITRDDIRQCADLFRNILMLPPTELTPNIVCFDHVEKIDGRIGTQHPIPLIFELRPSLRIMDVPG